jgi:ankyrin repeat protein
MEFDSMKNELLIISAEDGHLDQVKLLINKGIDIHFNFEDALIGSASHGHVDIVKYLVEQGADINAWNDGVLISSAENRRIEVVKYLIIDCNMTIKEETLQYLQDKNLTDVINIIKLRDLQQKLVGNLDNNNIIENKSQIKFKI